MTRNYRNWRVQTPGITRTLDGYRPCGEMADAADLKSAVRKRTCGFKSHRGHSRFETFAWFFHKVQPDTPQLVEALATGFRTICISDFDQLLRSDILVCTQRNGSVAMAIQLSHGVWGVCPEPNPYIESGFLLGVGPVVDCGV